MSAPAISADDADRLLAELRNVIEDLRHAARKVPREVEFVIEARPLMSLTTAERIGWIEHSSRGAERWAQDVIVGLQRMQDLRRTLGKLGTES